MKLREEVFELIINTLNEYNYCILRNYELLPYYNNDIDLLIEENTLEDLISKLIDRLEKKAVTYLYSVQFSCFTVYFYDTITEQFIHLDFFEEIKWKIFEYLPAKEILKTRVKYNSFFIPHPFYEMYELLLTRLIYQGKIKESYKNKIINLYNKINETSNIKLIINYNKEISENNWDKIEKELTKIRIKIIFNNILNPIRFIKYLNKFIFRIIRRLLKPPGIFVSFYGVDGSGKTTQIKLLSGNLSGIYSDKIRLFHFRPHLIYKKPKDIIVSNPHNQKNTTFLRSILKLIYYLFIYNWGYLTQILPFNAKNGLVIFDRYYFDLLIDPIRYRIKISKNIIQLFGKLIPKPDLSFVLLANEDLIHQRKNEISLDEIHSQQTRILKFFCSKNFFILETNSDTSNTMNEIKQIIINHVRKKN